MKQPVYPNRKFARAFGSTALWGVVLVELVWASPWLALLGYLPFLACCGYRAWYSFKQGCTGYGWLMILAAAIMAGVYVATYIFLRQMNVAG